MAAVRNAEQTRERILQATFELMYRNGYQGMRIDQILANTDLAKGALYHHFSNKQTLGYAVVDEILLKQMQNKWVYPLQNTEDPLAAIQGVLENLYHCITPQQMQLGCPLNNLSQEMAGIDGGFQQRLEAIYQLWSNAITTALSTGQKNGQVKQDVEPQVVAIFIISSLQGITGAAKCMQDVDMLMKVKDTLSDYISSLAA